MVEMQAAFIVVGGGLTGCAIASLLSKSKLHPKVILLEAGPDPATNPAVAGVLSGLSLLGGELDCLYKSEPEPNTANRVHRLNSGRALGGGTVLNLAGWLRADAADYDAWGEAVEDERWSYEGLKPWLRKSEHFHGTDEGRNNLDANDGDRGTAGPMHVYPVSVTESATRKYLLRQPIKDAWTELGVKENLRKTKGAISGLSEMHENVCPDGMRQASYTAYPLDLVEVHTNTPVHRVTFSGRTATGVELVDGRKIRAGKEVILCAGSYRTPQLLMLSGVGPSSVLATHGIPVLHDSPHVGQNLHDHFATYLAFRLRDPSRGYAFGSGHEVWTQNPALFKYLPWDWIVSESLPAELRTKHGINDERNLYEILTLYMPPGIPGIPVDGTHIATSTMLLRPTSRGSVSIRSGNPSDPPRIQTNYFSTQFDQDTLIHAVRRTLQAFLATDAMKSIVASESPPEVPGSNLAPLIADATDTEIKDRIRATGAQHHHSGGTASMGKVVDTTGKVLGVKGLRIADASIIPIPLGGHPQATLYAMVEQLASIIVEGEGS